MLFRLKRGRLKSECKCYSNCPIQENYWGQVRSFLYWDLCTTVQRNSLSDRGREREFITKHHHTCLPFDQNKVNKKENFPRDIPRYISVFRLAGFPFNEFQRSWSISCIFCLKSFSPLTSLLSVSKDWWTPQIWKGKDLKRMKGTQYYPRYLVVPKYECIRAQPRRGRYWEIHPRRPKDFPRPERFPEGEASFGGARTISQHQFFYRGWIRKSFPVDREGLTVLKSILPCWWWQIGF